MNTRIQIICAWAGPVFILLLLPIWFSMGFLPPPPPSLTADEVAAFYSEHRTLIRLGATLTMQLAIFSVAWSAAISAQIRRIESGTAPILAYLQLGCGAISALLFVIPAMFWTAAAYRPERDAQLVYLFNDQAWLALVMPVVSAMLQAFAIGLAILSDKRRQPIFPRWAAYINFWTGVAFLPGSLATFFYSGPFAWDGIFVFWLPLTVFSLWIITMCVLTASAAKRQALEATEFTEARHQG